MPLTIIGATYATPNKGFDVTTICQAMVNDGNDDIVASNDAFGDPDPGATKFLGVLYRKFDGTIASRGCAEGDSLDLVP